MMVIIQSGNSVAFVCMYVSVNFYFLIVFIAVLSAATGFQPNVLVCSARFVVFTRTRSFAKRTAGLHRMECSSEAALRAASIVQLIATDLRNVHPARQGRRKGGPSHSSGAAKSSQSF
jgi:hypothetical protein